MRYNPDVHHRRSIRLKDYDYSAEEMYYITICVQNRECILSEITNVGVAWHATQIKLTYIGKIVEDCLYKLEEMYTYVRLHDFVIMPNHLHMIIEIYNSDRAQICAPTISDNMHSLSFVHIVIKYIPSFE